MRSSATGRAALSIARIQVVAQRQAGAAIEGVAEADLAQVVALLLVVTALGQLATIVAGGDPGVEVGGVVGQHALAEQVLGTEGLQQGGLGALEIVVRGGVEAGGDVEAVEAVPEVLRAEAPGRKAPQRAQDGLLVPVGDGGFGSGGADAVDGGEQQVVGGSRSGARLGPEPEQGLEGAAALGGLPESAGQAEFEGGSLQGDRGGLVLNELLEAFGGAEVGLLDNPGIALDAAGGGDVIVGLVAFLFADDGWHIG